ncbi:hypothetical protein G6F56_012278 [Rhizopus delemar]|nr:hypothetical protein G6F56_012278 [Rhizopus delemar]
MASESASDYVWFLEQMKSKCFISNISPKIIATDRELALISAIAVVVPDAYNILCRWHINKNIKVKIAKYFPGISAERKDEILKAWSSMVSSSSTEVDFERNFSEFSMQFTSGEAGIRFIDYIKDTWVENHKEKFVAAWTDEHMHFNSTSSSRVEGAHLMLKRYIKSSTGHIDTVFERIHNSITNQLQQIDVQHARLTIIKNNVWRNVPMINKVRTRVSGFALEIAFQQYKKLESHSGESTVPLPECRSFLKKTMGNPFAHDMDFLRSFNFWFKLNDFHQQWHVEYTPVFRQTSRATIPRPESPEYEHPHFRGEELQAYQEELTLS